MVEEKKRPYPSTGGAEMNPSEMTDEQLYLAIAPLAGWTRYTPTTTIWTNPKDGLADYLPNWPGDIAAAMSLPLKTNDEKRQFALELAKILIPDINIGTAEIVYEAAFATARQRSEAWLKAKRGADG